MPKYIVVVEATNIYFKHSPADRLGLFATRRVEAAGIDEAGLRAIGLVQEELASIGGLGNLPDDPPVLSIDESYEVRSFEGEMVPGKGFSLYPM